MRPLVRALALVLAVAGLSTGCTPKVMPAGPAVAAPALAPDHVLTADGAKLPLRRWLPAGRPRAVVLALHGFNQYSAFFAGAGTWLAERGIASYAYDQRGFGGAPNRGLWPGAATLTDDLRQATAMVRARHPGVPVILFGESMGGAVIMTAMAGPEPPAADGIILAAPAVWGRASMPWYQNVALWMAVHTFPGGQLSGRGLGILASDNIEMLKALGRDPLVIKQTRVDAVFGLVNLMDDAMAAAAVLDTPLIVLYGENDQLIPEGAVREMLGRLPAAPAHPRTVAVYPKGWHMLTRDNQRETVWRDIAHWIVAPTMPLPSGADAHAAHVGACPPISVCARAFPPPGSTAPSAG